MSLGKRAHLIRALLTLLVAACNSNERAAPNSATSTTPGASANPPALGASSAAGASDTLATSAGDLKIAPIHHATVLLEWNGKAIYADPTSEDKYDKLPKADLILITDIHQDHLSPPTVASLKKDSASVVVPPAVAPSLPAQGVVVMKNGESKQVAGITIEAVPMYNLHRGPSSGQLYHDKGRGNGYVLTLGDKRIYLSGDTECTPEMKALKNIDVAFVCMNLPYTMPVSEAAECAKAFQPKIVYPYHYKGSNLDQFKEALKDQKSIEVRIRDWYP
jgi:L-ascorbate metabolism protein UlaG (beta-lactamase superfamily)